MLGTAFQRKAGAVVNFPGAIGMLSTGHSERVGALVYGRPQLPPRLHSTRFDVRFWSNPAIEMPSGNFSRP